MLIASSVHGGAPTVNRICDHPDIKAISFVGGDNAGKHIYNRATPQGKRVQANLGAKNHCVIMPDGESTVTRSSTDWYLSQQESDLNAVAGAGFGAAGQRCMALSVGKCGICRLSLMASYLCRGRKGDDTGAD